MKLSNSATVETTHFFEAHPLGADEAVRIAVKVDLTPGRPAEGGEVVVLGTDINLDSKIDKIPEDFLIEMAARIKDIRAGVYDDDLYGLAEREAFRMTLQTEGRR